MIVEELFEIEADKIPSKPPVGVKINKRRPWSEDSKSRPINFPMNCLPGVLTDFSLELNKANFSAPPDFCGSAALLIIGATIGKGVKCQIKESHIINANTYSIFGLPSASAKTYVVEKLAEPFDVWQDMKLRQDERVNKRRKVKLIKLKTEIRNAENDLKRADTGGERVLAESHLDNLITSKVELEETIDHEIFLNDVSEAGIIDALGKNNDFVCVICSDAQNFINKLKNGNKTSNDLSTTLLKATSGDRIAKKRAHSKVTIKKPAIGILLATQLEPLMSLLNYKNIKGLGLTPRFFIFSLDNHSTDNGYSAEPIDPKVQKKYKKLIDKIIELNTSVIHEGEKPVLVKLSPEAFKLYQKTFLALDKMAKNATLGEYANWLKKLPENTARLATLIHVCENGADKSKMGVISAAQMRKAIKFARYFQKHAKKAYMQAENVSSICLSEHVYNWCLKNEDKIRRRRDSENLGNAFVVKAGDIVESKFSGIGNAKDAEAVLDDIVEKGCAGKAKFKRKGTRGKSSTIYWLLK